MRRRGARLARRVLWLLVLAAGAAAAWFWAAPETQREAVLAEVASRTAPWRRSAEEALRRLDLPRLGIGARDGGGDDPGAESGARAAPGEGGGGTGAPGEGEGPRLAARAAGDDQGRVSRVEVVGGVPTVRLAAETQERGGIETRVLTEVAFASEILAFGRVVDLQPLLGLRARYTAVRYEADVVRATLAASKREYDRLFALHEDNGNVATKRLQEAEGAWKRDQAELRRVRSEMATIREAAQQEWGPILSAWALDDDKAFAPLLARGEVILLVTLPAGETLPEGTGAVWIARDGDRAGAREARYVSAAPYADPVVQGETYFFRAAAGRLRSDMRVDVWVDRSGQAAAGVIVPEAAVVWATGQAWAYVQIDDEHFARRAVSTETEAPGGWFVTSSVRPGERLVVAGAQMLYAEEFRWQIRDEDED